MRSTSPTAAMATPSFSHGENPASHDTAAAAQAPPDPRRLDALRAAQGEAIFRFCLRLCDGCRADAEDLAQEVFVAACTGLPRFAGRSALRTYIYKIAVYRWHRLRETQKRLTLVPLDSEATHEVADPRTVNDTTGRLTLEAAVAALPDLLRESFLLVKAEGLTHREAARVLDIPQGTVQYRVFEAVRRLRATLSEGDTE